MPHGDKTGGQVDYAGSATEFEFDPTELLDDLTTEESKPGLQAKSSSSTSRPQLPELSKTMELEDICVEGDGRLIETEKIQEGRVSGSTYLSYLNAAALGRSLSPSTTGASHNL
ncbi:hypothetical protein PGTUg99_035574 [Puccinia graminis f. sp. tritici]|uniref:Uncharacterized protein n=1 Tax=Puccinia graminis f. sp. tritici TaxID=56615 RepID=A0A5B0LXV8_PUCGR|nr:hypothetical protein PGTUg99_035574 [Puccinia graminis f. sp. tritici]